MNANSVITFKGNCVARALFSNEAESPDELSFHKGDLLTVLEQNASGLEGWWLCSLRGRQGICPGNRLRIIPGCYDNGSGVSTLAELQTSDKSLSLQSEVLTGASRKKIITPRRLGETFTYCKSPRATSVCMSYDIPLPSTHCSDDGLTKSSDDIHLSRSNSLKWDLPNSGNFRGPSDQYDSSMLLPEGFYDSPNPSSQFLNVKAPSEEQQYDIPRQRCSSRFESQSEVTTKQNIQDLCDSTSSFCTVPGHEEYDIPRSSPLLHIKDHATPILGSSTPSLTFQDSQSSLSSSASPGASDSLSLSRVGSGTSSNRSSLEESRHNLYDVPPEPRLFDSKLRLSKYIFRGGESQEKENLDALYDVPNQISLDFESGKVDNQSNLVSHSNSSDPLGEFGFDLSVMPFDANSSIEAINKLEEDIVADCENIITLQTSSSSSSSNLDEVISAVLQVHQNLTRLLNAVQSIIKNASREERTLTEKIVNVMQSVNPDAIKVSEILGNLRQLNSSSTSYWDQFIQVSSVMPSLIEKTQLLVSMIQTSALSTSKKRLSVDSDKLEVHLPVYHKEQQGVDCDTDLDQDNTQNTLTPLLSTMESLDENSIKEDSLNKRTLDDTNIYQSSSPTDDSPFNCKNEVNGRDLRVLEFYEYQFQFELTRLSGNIEAFFLAVENNQSPKVFVTLSKSVILSAHQLVFIGDAIQRGLNDAETRTRVRSRTNALCDATKDTVAAVQSAALRFPSFTEVQAMIDAFVMVSQLANNLKRTIY